MGFNRHVRTAKPGRLANEPTLTLPYLSQDGEEGYPSNLKVTVVYTLTNEDAPRLHYYCRTGRRCSTTPTLTSKRARLKMC
ncbi:hypothetical protein GO988_14400 [Hymenobacter sp. HMF4947]|uniref:Uncharacterized protein n=1 Tax=Hymenobacter ginkgonis TaxID=2682976 RepID=A0A7K1TGN5_9BACT|nr:hypothetical protein [Hymenobacter ginkgonis]